MLHRRFLLLALLGWLVGQPVHGQEPIRFARTPDISPDGKLVAFSYLGDIHVVESIGGTARAVTSHPAHDLNPVFSPDGQHLAFSSNRHGSYDIFVVLTRGGRPTRLTFDSASDMVTGWSPDGKHILFASSRGTAYPPSWDLYTVPLTGGRAQRITSSEGKDGSFSPRGDLLAYARGPGSWYRKGYRGSANDDLWVCNADGTGNRRLTTFEGQDGSPMWAPDGNSLYYVSEYHGTANVVKQSLRGSDKPVPVTNHKEDNVRRARISRDGQWIVYECGFDLWVTNARDGKSRKLAIEVNADDRVNPERVVTFTKGATEFALSHDEKHLAFVVHGKLVRMAVAANAKATQMTFGPWNDHGAAWSPDGSRMVFISDRKGHDDLYLLEADDPDHPRFTDAHRYKVKQLTDTREAEFGVSFSPDGKKVGFIRGGKLWTMDPDGANQKTVVDQVQVFDYEWSPDSRWIVFARRDGSFASELYVVPATGATAAHPVRNITRYATFNAGVTWSADGKKIAFLSDRRGPGNLMVLDLLKEAAPGFADPAEKAAPLGNFWNWVGRGPLAIDWDDLHTRARSIVPGLVEEAAISPDGSKVAFRDGINRDLWVANTSGSQITRLTNQKLRPRQLQWTKKRGLLGGTIDILFCLDGDGQIRLAKATPPDPKAPGPAPAPSPGGASGDTANLATLPFKVKMTIKNKELHKEMFDQSWRFLSENFYDSKFHGRDWDEVRTRYRPVVEHVGMKEDLYALLYLMMGELNASHLGVSGFFPGPEEETAELGLIFDTAHRGKGLKVAEILKRGPADRRGIKLAPGDVVVAVDGVELDDKTNLNRLLNGKVGEAVVLQVTKTPDDPKTRRRVELQPIGRTAKDHKTPGATDLMYDRWVAQNAARVGELSKGKLGYIHIPSMDDDGLDRFVRSLYSDNFDKEAIVLDVRFNGGGFTHDQVLNYLGSREHTLFRHRDGGQGWVLRSADRKWTKPLVVLINNRSFSDAEIFPSAARTLGLAKLVGEPTGGAVIGTSAVRLIDGSTFRIPRIGVYTMRGVNMDREGVRPDIYVENHPDELARGVDAQLARAVSVLQAEVVEWKKRRPDSVAARPEGPAVAPAPLPPLGGPMR